MNDEVYIAMMAMTMCSDPWPLNQGCLDIVNDFLNTEAVKRGYEDWITAYHEMPHSNTVKDKSFPTTPKEQ